VLSGAAWIDSLFEVVVCGAFATATAVAADELPYKSSPANDGPTA
jgi:hypothetical protein